MARFFISILLGISCFSIGTARGSLKQELDSEINAALHVFHIPGAAIGVIADGQIVMLKGYGFRNLEEGLPVTEKTLFPIASCTKAFTAYLLAQLVEEGKIGWDDLVIQHIPEFRLFDQQLTSQVTLRDLAAHRVGLYRNDAIWYFLNLSKRDVIGILPYLEPVHKLREKFEYSNLLYTILGGIIEKMTGLSWEQAVQANIFLPLGMNASNTTLEELLQQPDIASPYAEIEGNLAAIPYHRLDPVSPGGAINSNVAEMAKWMQFQLSNEKKLAEMHSNQMPIPATAGQQEVVKTGYGLGWFVGSYRDLCWISHGGHNDGFHAEVSLLPEKKIGLVILTNSSTDGGFFISAIRNILFDRLLGLEKEDWIHKALEERRNAKHPLTFRPQKVDQPSPQELKIYPGVYAHPAYGAVQIHLEGEQLALTYGHAHVELTYKNGSVFYSEFRNLLIYGLNPFVEVTFVKNSSGEICEVHIPFESFRGGKPIIFQRSFNLERMKGAGLSLSCD